MNNITENNPVENELDAIRLTLYEQTKDMTASEVTAYIRKQVAPTVEKYSIPTAPKTKSVRPAKQVL